MDNKSGKMKFIRRMQSLVPIFSLLFLIVLTGCFRGQPKEKPPIHPVLDMDFQSRYEAQEAAPFFENNMTMRPTVYGTIPRGHLNANDSLHLGIDATGDTLDQIPLVVDMELMERGQKEYDIYCTPCHSPTGDGRGIMMNYNYIPATSFHVDRLRNTPDGHIYRVITNGLRNMPAYSHQISVEDRWAIVAYVRALQRSQNASLSDVPEQMRDQLR